MTNPQTKRDKLWGQCPPGAIQNVADTAKVNRSVTPAVNLQRRNLLTVTATAAGVVVLGGMAYLSLRQPAFDNSPVPGTGGGPIATQDFGGINCIEVVRNIPAYIDNAIGDQRKSESIKQHLEVCEKCRAVYEFNMKS